MPGASKTSAGPAEPVWHAADVLATIGDILDRLLHWRVWLCTAGGLAAALVLQWAFPDLVGGWVLWVLPAAGFAIGLLWEWRS